MSLFTKICVRVSVHRCFTRTYALNSTYNVPKSGDRGVKFDSFFEGILTQVLVIVGMSGGVDSSVTALLLAKKVCQKMQRI